MSRRSSGLFRPDTRYQLHQRRPSIPPAAAAPPTGVSYVGAGADATGTASGLSVPLPTGLDAAQNDVMFLDVIARSTGATVPTLDAISGWTQFTHADTSNTFAIRIATYARKYQAGDSAPSVTGTPFSSVAAKITAYRNADVPSNAVGYNDPLSSGGDANLQQGPITVGTATSWLHAITGTRSSETVTQDASLIERAEVHEAVGASLSVADTATTHATGATTKTAVLSAATTTKASLITEVPLTGTAPTGTLNHVISGAATTSGFTVAVRTTGASSVRLKVSTTSDLLTSPVFSSAATPDAQGYAKCSITGLAAGTLYHYGVEVDGAVAASPRGQCKTVASGAGSFSFVFASCHEEGGLTTDSAAWTRAKARNPDLCISVGDFGYWDITSNDPASFRTNLNGIVGLTNVGSMLRDVPFVDTWSDHDFGSNNANGSSASAPAAQSTYRQVFPHYPLEVADGIYHSFTWRRVRFIVTDERSFKSPQANTDDAAKTVLGATQKTWFKNLITSATEPLIFWVQDIPWIAATLAGDDEWSGYNTERQELAAHIVASGKRVILLAGDMHSLAADDGTHSAGGIPVFHAAPWHNSASSKGGPYTVGPVGSGTVEQYGFVAVTDTGSQITVAFTGYGNTDAADVQMTLHERVITDTVAIADSHAKALERPQTDAVPVVDAAGQALAVSRIQTDLEPVADSQAQVLAASQTVTDPVSVADSTSQSVVGGNNFTQTITDPVGITDVAKRPIANTLEGGSDGTTVSTGNSGGTSGDAFESAVLGTGATNRYSSAHAHGGGLAVEFATGGTAAVPAVGWTTLVGTQTEVYFRGYLYFTANPAAAHRILHVHSGVTQRCSLQVTTAGLLQMSDSTGSILAADRGATAIALNAWNRVEFHAKLDATVGQYEFRLYKTNPDAAISGYDEQVTSAATKNLGGSGDTYRFGVTGTPVANVVSWWADDLAVDPMGWIGPAVPPAPQNYTQTITDAVPVADSLAGQVTERTFTDPVAVADAASQQLTLGRIVTDTIPVADGGSITDVATTLTDPVAVADSQTKVSDTPRALTDPVATVDSATGVQTLARSATDPVVVADSTSQQASGVSSYTLTDQVSVADQAGQQVDALRSQTDPVATADSQAREQSRSLTDPVAVADAASQQVAASQTITDPVVVADTSSQQASGVISVTLTDTVAVADSTAKDLTRPLTDPVAVADSTARASDAARAVTDPVVVADTSSWAAGVARTISDPITLADLLDQFVTGPSDRFLTDLVPISDSVSYVMTDVSPRWVEGATSATGMVEGGLDGAGIVEGSASL